MKILYICTHNRCRSILSEAITNHLSQGEIEAKSAGSQPSGQVHPLTLKYLQDAGISIDGLQSQSWDELENFEPDVVITVCDSAANETCPVWFGKAIKIHWGLADPSKIEGTDAEIEKAFHAVMSEISERVSALKNIAHIQQPEQLKQALTALGASAN
ncbi:arsenate reductase ArsC [Paraneptunicella aestuarii]|uniref:arsenate reductase ArsC n=1 Tax=Paraneptunicella aestuarii TaxID=2831148 RepID=UPI001E32C235|nr:arsenate reductase ArsC [Paraneptunicella aestuarii]UAA39790.1 arsenate reductase ArsC [Paraneptunicella aestuarii]